jgi:hypothetical protein
MRLPRRASALAASALVAAGCSDPDGARLRATTKATYDKASGKLTEITYDANKNGRIDTWTEMDGSRPVRSRIDRNEDGRPDRWEYYDAAGRLARVGFSRADTGKPDAWAFSAANGRIERIEIASSGDEARIERREFYAARPEGGDDVLVRVEEDANRDGRTDKWETYEAGALKTAEFDENADGRPDRRLTYQDARLVLIETKPDAAGRYGSATPVK